MTQKTMREYDCGVVYGHGRVTVHELPSGKWAVRWHPTEGDVEAIVTCTNLDVAREIGWQEHARRKARRGGKP